MLIFIINNLFDLTNGSFKNLINTNLQECDCLKKQLHSFFFLNGELIFFILPSHLDGLMSVIIEEI